jgi:hypothetical protein
LLPVPRRGSKDRVVVVADIALAHQQAGEILERVLGVGGIDGLADRSRVMPSWWSGSAGQRRVAGRSDGDDAERAQPGRRARGLAQAAGQGKGSGKGPRPGRVASLFLPLTRITCRPAARCGPGRYSIECRGRRGRARAAADRAFTSAKKRRERGRRLPPASQRRLMTERRRVRRRGSSTGLRAQRAKSMPLPTVVCQACRPAFCACRLDPRTSAEQISSRLLLRRAIVPCRGHRSRTNRREPHHARSGQRRAEFGLRRGHAACIIVDGAWRYARQRRTGFVQGERTSGQSRNA